METNSNDGTDLEPRHLDEAIERAGDEQGMDRLVSQAPDEHQTLVDESVRLRELQAEVRNQDDLERNIGREADRLLLEQANDRDIARLEKTTNNKAKLQAHIRHLHESISQPIGTTKRSKLRVDLDCAQRQVDQLNVDVRDIEDRMDQRQHAAERDNPDDTTSSGRLPNESQREFLIRTGKITPFSKFGLSLDGEPATDLRGALLDAEDEPENVTPDDHGRQRQVMSHRNLRRPGFAHSEATDVDVDLSINAHRPNKRQRLSEPLSKSGGRPERAPKRKRIRVSDSSEGSEYEARLTTVERVDQGQETDDIESGSMPDTEALGKQPRRRARAAGSLDGEGVEDLRGVDDGSEEVYRSRLRKWSSRRSRARRMQETQDVDVNGSDTSGLESDMGTDILENVQHEAYLPHPDIADTIFDGGYRIPGDIYPNLFDYQKTGVQWLWELYTQQVGGIVGDEMGLGKTIQVIAFLAGLHYSKKLTKPIIVVCPATVMKQWVKEFHRWWPPFRVAILHSSGSGMINLRTEQSKEDHLLGQNWEAAHQSRPLTAGQKKARRVLKPILDGGGVLVTTYSGLQTYAPLLVPVDWDYAILDEGHKIRNPNTAITIYCKELRTSNRVILSGTPMQNNLIELWSLFDFVFPMRLGTLVAFRNQFDIPIRQGGYANASNLQVQTAFKCAETLKDAISPYLLQRFKIDVAADLPKKSEQVLFCRLTKLQREDYQRFLSSNDMDAIISGKRQVLYGVDILRKICNHPDLQDHRNLSIKSGFDYGNPARSGKMQVVGSFLELWKDTGHKTLLFAQHRIMLDILERYVRSIKGIKYRRMDGNTPIQLRQSLVDEFNNDPNLHVFLLTTKVGGLGINLTGADRVIIYDPDWNPSTDLQARERAWRLGQKREVTIYRLMTAGTIEEKIYHRQIFKQFLTNKILKDPKQRQTFHLSDLHDLFSLGNDDAPTETSTLFQDAQVKYSASKNEATAENNATLKDDTSIEDIAGVNSVEQYSAEVAEKVTTNDRGICSESRVMEGIFARSGIHSALEHDQIVGGKNAVTADPAIIEFEAKKVAAEAAQELRRAGEVARTVPVGTPTWTGQFGVSGRPQETTPQSAFGSTGRHRGAGGLSSSNLLATLRQRQTYMNSGHITPRTASPTASSSLGTGTSNRTLPQGKDFGRLIRNYLLLNGGNAYTQMLIDHFNRYCTTAKAAMEFKETLKAIATLEKGGRARGRWKLNPEYARI